MTIIIAHAVTMHSMDSGVADMGSRPVSIYTSASDFSPSPTLRNSMFLHQSTNEETVTSRSIPQKQGVYCKSDHG